jgi:hypothetical protein
MVKFSTGMNYYLYKNKIISITTNRHLTVVREHQKRGMNFLTCLHLSHTTTTIHKGSVNIQGPTI